MARVKGRYWLTAEETDDVGDEATEREDELERGGETAAIEVEVVEEDAADAAHLLAVRQIEVLVAGGLVELVVGAVLLVESGEEVVKGDDSGRRAGSKGVTSIPPPNHQMSPA
jgi:hypothetical protein